MLSAPESPSSFIPTRVAFQGGTRCGSVQPRAISPRPLPRQPSGLLPSDVNAASRLHREFVPLQQRRVIRYSSAHPLPIPERARPRVAVTSSLPVCLAITSSLGCSGRIRSRPRRLFIPTIRQAEAAASTCVRSLRPVPTRPPGCARRPRLLNQQPSRSPERRRTRPGDGRRTCSTSPSLRFAQRGRR